MKDKNDNFGMCSKFTYRFLCVVIKIIFRICHPIIHIEGRENLPEGAAVLCANHSSFSDPIWIVAWANLKRHPRIMAKKELFSHSLLSWFFTKLGAFPVDRDSTDISAIKQSLKTLKDDNKLLIFPEGTRIREGIDSKPHGGAILIANKVNAPVIPVYLSVKKGLFSPVRLIFGKPFSSDFGGERPDGTALEARSKEMMDTIYALGEQV